jgi:signal transduction histidine kinase
VVAVSLVAVGIATTRITRRELQRFMAIAVRVPPGGDVPNLRVHLEEHFRAQGSWEGAQAIVGAACAQGAQKDARVVVLDASGRVAATSLPEMLRGMPTPCIEPSSGEVPPPAGVIPPVGTPEPGTRQQILTGPDGTPAGTLLTFSGEPPAVSEQRRQLVRSVERGTLATVLLAGVLALAATALLARRMLRPIEELTGIAREMAGGNLSRRAGVTSRDEIGELGRTFNAMADGLERIETLRRRMVHDVAHELRTPLTNIRGHLEAVQDGLLEPTPAVIDSIHEEALALQHLVDDLQDLALAEAGQLRLEPRELELLDAVERVVRPLGVAVQGAAIRVEVPPTLRVVADPDRLAQVLRNLLANALAHTPPSGVVTVSAAPADGEERMVEVRVADTGPGIAAADIPHVFERFYRGDRSRSRATGGAGLGLAITRRLVEAHGGHITAESPPGEGATFRFTVPAPAVASRDEAELAGETAHAHRRSG